ncbi:MAG: hypothetical protein WCV62_01715 [Candidatus Peribacteraceae bacterium]
MDQPSPYVQATGFVDERGVRTVCAQLERIPFRERSGHRLALGFGMDHEALRTGQFDRSILLRDPAAFPALLKGAGENMTMLHYTPPRRGAKQLLRVRSLAEVLPHETAILCDAVQINGQAPAPEEVRRLRDTYPHMQVSLPLDATAARWETDCILEMADTYAQHIHHLLIDSSGGRGKPVDMPRAAALAAALQQAFPRLGVGVAGGFGADNAEERIRMLRGKLATPFNVDAEGQLQTNGTLNLVKTLAYFHAALRGFSS